MDGSSSEGVGRGLVGGWISWSGFRRAEDLGLGAGADLEGGDDGEVATSLLSSGSSDLILTGCLALLRVIGIVAKDCWVGLVAKTHRPGCLVCCLMTECMVAYRIL